MDMKIEHRYVSLADQIFEKLEKDILVGEYNKGEILTETKLSETLGVSRTPIREALRRLEQERIITITPKGAQVIGISYDDIAAIYEMRVRIEGYAARRAAEYATDEEKEKIREILELQAFYLEKKNPEQIMECDSRFHRMLYDASASMPLANTLTELHKKIIKFRKTAMELTERAAHSCSEHKGIYDAIVAGDGDLAEELTVAHIKNARDNILARIMKNMENKGE